MTSMKALLLSRLYAAKNLFSYSIRQALYGSSHPVTSFFKCIGFLPNPKEGIWHNRDQDQFLAILLKDDLIEEGFLNNYLFLPESNVKLERKTKPFVLADPDLRLLCSL